MHEPRVARSTSDLQLFLKRTIERSRFAIEEIAFSQQKDWSLRDGSVSHASRGFFQITGFVHRGTGREELVMYQPQGALTGLALHRRGDSVLLLLQARIEPGNTGIGNYGPTIQSTPANYSAVHGGRATSCLDLFFAYDPRVTPVTSSSQLDLGRRYIQKTKFANIVEVDELLPTDENMIWAELGVVIEAAHRDFLLNSDLRALLPTMDWDLYIGPDAPAGRHASPPGAIHSLLAGSRAGRVAGRFQSLSALTDWRVDETGIVDVAGRGVSVRMHRVTAVNREVATWAQPLMHSSNRGLVALFMRESGGQSEFLLTVEQEFGTSGETTIFPSHVRYPGEPADHDERIGARGEVVRSFAQSEEGGRFFRNENLYLVIRVSHDVEPAPNQAWVDTAILKDLLTTSNRVSIQLRSISSVLFDRLDPRAFAQRVSDADHARSAVPGAGRRPAPRA